MSQPGAPAGSAPSAPLHPIDSHCHLADEAFTADIVDVVLRARAAGSPTALCILDAGEVGELRRAAGLRELWPSIRFAVGVHPMRADTYRADPLAAVRAIEQALESIPDARAIGEMGLDYHYDYAKPPLQQSVFAAQVKLARTRRLPVIVHTREADQDTVRILKDSGKGEVRGVFHCSCRSRSRTPSAPWPRPCRPIDSSSKPTAPTSRRCRIAASGTSRPWSSTWPKRWRRRGARPRPRSSSRRPRTSKRCSTRSSERAGQSGAVALTPLLYLWSD